jgi:UDP-2,3-diacylglucosamine hydrolase
MTTLFISDLHLDSGRPAITRLFLDFLEQRAVKAEALYILGDLFEVWVGDDDDGELGQTVAGALKTLSQQGVAVYLLHGNRDFLLGAGFTTVSGAGLLPEATVIALDDIPTLIMHGDTLCTDDVDYQALRARVRSPAWQAQALALPLTQRRLLAGQLREGSQQAIQGKAYEIMDVNPQAVENALRTHRVQRLIHGHTHRPGIHEWLLDGEPVQRIVLGAWYQQGSVLCCDADGCRLETLPLG